MSQLSPSDKEGSLNEIRILASLEHPNIIGYKEAFYDMASQTLNIVMEYADDGDLSSKIKHNKANGLMFTEHLIWDYLIQILYGLKYLHDNKIMHRDLKSANLFLMKDNTVKIGDLNVSKITRGGMVYTQTGTPFYASPEIWADKPYDYKCDIWSVGCIVYEMCTLRPPFKGTSLKELCQCVQKGKYDDIPSYYSKELSYVISKFLVVNPKRRTDCDALLKDDVVVRKIKEVMKEKGNVRNEEGGMAMLMKTIKMPRNLKEINKALPMKRYRKIQKEEMMENDGYETMKRKMKGNNNNNGASDVQELMEFFDVEKEEKERCNVNYNKGSVNVYQCNNKKCSNNKNVVRGNNNNNIRIQQPYQNVVNKGIKNRMSEPVMRNKHVQYNNNNKLIISDNNANKNNINVKRNYKRPYTGVIVPKAKHIPPVNNNNNKPHTPINYHRPVNNNHNNIRPQRIHPQSANYNNIKKKVNYNCNNNNNHNNNRYISPHYMKRINNNNIKLVNNEQQQQRHYYKPPPPIKKNKVVIEKYYYIPKQNQKGQGRYERAREYERERRKHLK
jgi:NIMA (never in mitosis gene a)-related kinase